MGCHPVKCFVVGLAFVVCVAFCLSIILIAVRRRTDKYIRVGNEPAGMQDIWGLLTNKRDTSVTVIVSVIYKKFRWQ